MSYDSELFAPALELIQEQISAQLVNVFGSLAITYKLEYIHSQIAIVTKVGDMNQKEREERKMLATKYARKQLANETWPQVMAVFGYRNPKAPRTSDEEFARLKVFYEQASYPNMATFIELVHFAEREHNVTMSFNLSLRRRLVSGGAPELTAESSMLLFDCPDILVGTRRGIEGAAVWLKTFSEAIPKLTPEPVQMINKIFGEAVEFLRGHSRIMTVQEIFEAITSDVDDILQLPDEPLKH